MSPLMHCTPQLSRPGSPSPLTPSKPPSWGWVVGRSAWSPFCVVVWGMGQRWGPQRALPTRALFMHPHCPGGCQEGLRLLDDSHIGLGGRGELGLQCRLACEGPRPPPSPRPTACSLLSSYSQRSGQKKT